MQVIDYKCENCGSSMIFDSSTGMLSCHSCGKKDNIDHIPNLLGEPGVPGGQGQEYHCNSCGAVIPADEMTTAAVCGFCGASAILADRLSGELSPVKVLPFAISKEEAMKAFRKWCRNGRLTPTGFMTADRIKSITGLYVPFWLYELNNHIEVHAHATKVRSYVQGDYHYTETQHFDVYRRIKLNYTRVPLDASEKMSDKLMDKLEPFPYNQLKDFKKPYLAGYNADKYSYDEQELFPRVKEKIRPFIESYIQSAVAGYSSVSYTNKQIDTSLTRADYALLPVWVVHYDFNKLEHSFAMNGQTGKVVGKPPLSFAKITAWFAGISGAALLSLKLVSLMMGGGFW
ncbi:MAG: hypothetical protein K0R57_977 [Paenibacillaceae bacterium]|jgi:DNA-directed RNA polymerase subunit RPC12/RpoP|nr:hypothetical protein [Paenibacillaceae bacterium]